MRIPLQINTVINSASFTSEYSIGLSARHVFLGGDIREIKIEPTCDYQTLLEKEFKKDLSKSIHRELIKHHLKKRI